MSELVSPEIKNSRALASKCGQNHTTWQLHIQISRNMNNNVSFHFRLKHVMYSSTPDLLGQLTALPLPDI